MHVAEPKSHTGRSEVLYPATNPGKRPITADDLWRFSRVGGPAPAPDGSAVVVPVTTYDMEQNRGRARLWLVPVAPPGGEPRPITTDEYSSTDPAYSPDGKRIAFVRAQGEEKSQLYVLPLEGGEAERLTDMTLGVFDPKWFHDGTRIAYGTYLYS